MTIVQQATGSVVGGTTFTVTLPSATVASNTVALFVDGNTTATTPAGWTLRASQVNWLGQYLFDKAGDGTASWTVTYAGSGSATTWYVAEILNGAYDTSQSVQTIANSVTSSTSPTLTPAAGTKDIIAAITAGVGTSATPSVTYSGWTGGFVQQATLAVTASQDNPSEGIAMIGNVAATGSYATTVTLSQTSTEQSWIVASYATTAAAAGSNPHAPRAVTRVPRIRSAHL